MSCCNIGWAIPSLTGPITGKIISSEDKPELIIVVQPQSIEVEEGQPAEFILIAENATSYQWQEKIGGEWIDIPYTSSTLLVVTQPEDNGREFRCVVSNGEINIISNEVSLSVLYGPIFITQPEPVTVDNGEEFTLSVTVTGNPTPTVQWQFFPIEITGSPYQGQSLTSTSAGQWTINDSPISGETGDTLVVPESVLLGDKIACAGSNELEVIRIPDSCGIRIDTTKPGSASDTFIIRANTGDYDCRIYWGDGSYSDVTAFDDPNLEHQYADPGEYDVQISGQFARFHWDAVGDKDKLLAVDQLGRTGWDASQIRAFHSCTNLSRFICDGDEWSHVTNLPATFSTLSSLMSFPNMDFLTTRTLSGTWWPGPTGSEMGVINAPNCTTFANTWRNRGTFTSFAPRTFQSMTGGLNTFNGSTVPTQDYSEILIHIESDNPNSDVTFHGGNSKYNSAAAVARADLVARGWTITDGGPE